MCLCQIFVDRTLILRSESDLLTTPPCSHVLVCSQGLAPFLLWDADLQFGNNLIYIQRPKAESFGSNSTLLMHLPDAVSEQEWSRVCRRVIVRGYHLGCGLKRRSVRGHVLVIEGNAGCVTSLTRLGFIPLGLRRNPALDQEGVDTTATSQGACTLRFPRIVGPLNQRHAMM